MKTFNKSDLTEKFYQLIKYGVVGLINTLITWVVLSILMNVFGVSYKLSNAIGYAAGFLNSFIMNKLWTFKANQVSTIKQFVKFTAVFAVCYFIQLGLVIFMVEKLSLGENISQLIGMGFYTIIGFLFNKLFTFKG